MNIKELLVLVAFALFTSWGIQYGINHFFGKKGDDQASSFVVAPVKQESRPLNVEVDFLDGKVAAPQITTVVTKWGECAFSTQGGVLERLSFYKEVDGKRHPITTLFSPTQSEKERGGFLLAFEQKTPLNYELVGKESGDGVTKLIYRAHTAGVRVEKTFVIHHAMYQLDLALNIQGNQLGHPRIFVPAPFMPSLGEGDVVSAIVVNKKGAFEKIARKDLDAQTQGWYQPELFGTDDRYFIHAMVKDPEGFVQRAYYHYIDKTSLTAILEGKSEPAMSARLSFFVGPKEGAAIVSVSPVLEKAFEYSGIFAPVAKLLLAILNWLYKYLHNYGYAIIALTFLMKLLLLPFTMRGEKSMKENTERQKKLAYIEKKYKDDPQALARERMEFMKKHGMPGLGGGCLPLLIQIPIFFALSRVLSSSIELYQARMLWIRDLAAPDPYYIIPGLLVAVMLLQALYADPKQRGFMLAAAVVFGAFASSFSAGLGLYILVSTGLSVFQTIVMRLFGKK